MRVVQVVCSDRFAGVERHVAVLSASLATQGVDVTVVGGHPGEMRRTLAGTDVRHVAAATPTEASRALAALDGADIVNSHMTDADVVAARRRRRLGARHVSTRHFAARRGSRALVRPLLRWVLRGLDGQIATSQFIADAVEGAVDVVHPGVVSVDVDGDRSRTVLVAQRLEREKDTASALHAWSRTGARSDGWRMQIAGDGAERASLEALASDLGVAGTVDFLGFRRDVQDLMAGAAMLLAPAPDEHLGLSVLEAMARATPVVATASGGHLETAGEVDATVLYPSGDADAAAAVIDGLAIDPHRRGELGAALRARQQRAFTVEGAAAATLAVYERALA